jgi:hypothetical protein
MALAFMVKSSEMVPANVVDVLPPPTVSVVEEPAPPVFPSTIVLAPEPVLDRDAMDGAALLKLTVAVPEDGFITKPPAADVLLPSAKLLAAINWPLVTVVRPVYVLVPPSVWVPVEAMARLTGPEMVPA